MRRKDFKKIAIFFGAQTFPDFTVVGAATTTTGASATTVNAALPAVAGGIQAGDLILAWTSNKLQRARTDAPAGFKCPKITIHNNGGNGSNLGATVGQTYYKEAVGGEAGTLTFNLPDPAQTPATTDSSVVTVSLMVLRKGSSRAKWQVDVVDGTFRNWNEAVNTPAAVVMRSLNKMHLQTGDGLFCFASSNTQASLYNNKQLSVNAALTVQTISQNLIDAGTTFGNRQYVFASQYKISAGSAEDFLTYSADATVVALRAPWVLCHFVRVRQVESEPTYVPSRFDDMDPSCFDMGAAQIDNHSGLWGKMRKDNENLAAVTYGIKNYLGVPHFYIKHDFSNTAVSARRGELHIGVQQPSWPAGTKMFEGLRLRYAALPTLRDQWIAWQNHTGTAAGTPNHPTLAFEFCRANQYQQINNWMMGLGNYVPVGTLIVAMNCGFGANKYYAVPTINCIGVAKDIPLAWMIKAGTAGNGRFILQSDGVTLIDDAVHPTIAADPAELGDEVPGSGNGSVAGVMGMNKYGGYLHQIPTSGFAAKMLQWQEDFVNAGYPPEMEHLIPRIRRSVKLITDPDYDDSYDAATLAAVRV
jgi:hypothetical protein